MLSNKCSGIQSVNSPLTRSEAEVQSPVLEYMHMSLSHFRHLYHQPFNVSLHRSSTFDVFCFCCALLTPRAASRWETPCRTTESRG